MPKSQKSEFIVNDSEDQDSVASEEDFSPDAKKKSKTKTAKSKPSASPKEFAINLTGKKRVQVSQFKGKTLVGIREYYEKDGALLPGKKGISLTTDDWRLLKEAICDIDAAISEAK